MPWPEFGIWSGKTAAELRPVIVALCNAVGDRYECIGWDRPEWPVNLDQSESTLDLGYKSAALVEADLYRLDLFRYGWWGMVANAISTLVNLGNSSTTPGTVMNPYGTLTGNRYTLCGGWSKTGTGAGHGSDLWTIEDLETHVGLGTLSYSVIGGPMHLFDEVAPNRLRQMLDELIYPVIFPRKRKDYFNLNYEGWTTADTLSQDEGDNTFGPPEGSDWTKVGDDFWSSLTYSDGDPVGNNGGAVGVQMMPNIIAGGIQGQKKTLAYWVIEFDSIQNGVGATGEIIAQHICMYNNQNLSGALTELEFNFLGTSASVTGSSDVIGEVSDGDFACESATGKQYFEVTMTNPSDPESPFYVEATPENSYFSDFGYCWVTMIAATGGAGTAFPNDIAGSREDATRFILDITAHLSDQ